MPTYGIITVLNSLRGIVAEPHKWCGTDFLDLASLDPLWNTPSWDIKNGILEKNFLAQWGVGTADFLNFNKNHKIDPLWDFCF